MMSPDNLAANPPSANKEETHQGSGSNSRKTATANTRQAETVQTLKCPRCDSPNTKFCYYNNYSLTQPRHFCKTCRRYWTKGGALRNVPIGGGCRKNKKITSKSSSSRLSSGDSKDSAGSSYSDIGGFKFFNTLSPAMDFQLGGLNNNFPRFQSSTIPCVNNNYNHHQLPTSFGDILTPVASINSCFGLDPSGNNSGHLMGLNFPLSSSSGLKLDHGSGSGFNGGVIQEMGITGNNNLASSIESLSSINQDLHWKLQQQRLAMLFGGGDDNQQKELENQTQRPQPILFENLDISSKPDDSHHGVAAGGNSRKDDNGGGIGNLATEWYFDKYSSYAPAVNPTPTNSSSAGNNGIQAWSNFDQYTALP